MKMRTVATYVATLTICLTGNFLLADELVRDSRFPKLEADSPSGEYDLFTAKSVPCGDNKKVCHSIYGRGRDCLYVAYSFPGSNGLCEKGVSTERILRPLPKNGEKLPSKLSCSVSYSVSYRDDAGIPRVIMQNGVVEKLINYSEVDQSLSTGGNGVTEITGDEFVSGLDRYATGVNLYAYYVPTSSNEGAYLGVSAYYTNNDSNEDRKDFVGIRAAVTATAYYESPVTISCILM